MNTIKRIGQSALALAFVIGAANVAVAQQNNNQQQDQQNGGGYNRRQQYQQDQQSNNQYNQNNVDNQGYGRRGGRGGGNRLIRGQYAFNNSGEFNNDYGILADMNIFMRNRQPRPDPSTLGPREGRQLTPEEMNVLTGVVKDTDNAAKLLATVENIMQSANVAVKVGDKIANGEIVDISVTPESGVHYRRNGSTESVWIPIGSNFAGTAINSMVDARAQSVLSGSQFQSQSNQQQQQRPQATQAPLVPMNPNDASLSIEERLRARRMAEAQGLAMPAAIAPQPVEQPQADQQPPQPPADPSSIEERLRLRRLQEVGPAR